MKPIHKRGPGRPKKEPTKVMRVPVSKVEAVKKIIKGLEVTIQVKTK